MKRGALVQILMLSVSILGLCSCSVKEEEEQIPIDGGKTEEWYSDYKEEISSKDIISFRYDAPGYRVQCDKEGDSLHILSSGGNGFERDGTYFRLDYNSDDLSFLDTLQNLIEEEHLTKDNGHVVEVGGLPAGLGDTLSVKYQSGEAIYKSSNQFMMVSDTAGQRIYEAFHEFAISNGWDFTSEGSNVELYNDANEDYLQGKWTGKHFGREFTAQFTGNRVKIYCDGKLTDDCEYTVFEGCVRKNRLAEGVTEAKDEYDYEEFSEISCFRKANDFTIVAYFMKDSYSTDRLLRQK